MQRIDRFLRRTHIAYFTMEIALRDEIHTFSGGLGVLAGDTARSSADLELPIVFVSLICRQGYVRQEIDAEGKQKSYPNPWDPRKWLTPLGAMVVVPVEGRDVWVRPWLYVVDSPLGGRVPVLLLDTDVEQNTVEDRTITDRLYGGDEAYRLKQEIVLGIGGAQLLQALGFAIRVYHLNEGHAAFLTLHLLRRLGRPEAVRERCIFTTHTPVEPGHDKFAYKLVDRSLHGYVEARQLKALAGADKLNMTQLALNLSGFVNGVARKHAEVTRELFPGYEIHAVTNGVHVQTWAHPNFARLFQEKFPNWAHEPEMLVHADQFSDTAVWEAHQGAKHDLVALVKQRCDVDLQLDVPIIGYARRMTGYKRPELIFSDMQRLAAIARQWPFQLVFSGIAHPNDGDGKKGIEQVHAVMREAGGDVPIAFIPGYNMKVAGALVAGADVWLNNPVPPLEASGTSGMKAALNGVQNLSVLDGWWLEGWVEGTTGWAIGETHDPGIDHAGELYAKLAGTVLPLYHKDRARWIWMMKQAIKIGAYFNSQRMMRRYASEAYVR